MRSRSITYDAVARFTAQASTSPNARSRRPCAAASTSTTVTSGQVSRSQVSVAEPRFTATRWPCILARSPGRWSPRRRNTTAGELT